MWTNSSISDVYLGSCFKKPKEKNESFIVAHFDALKSQAKLKAASF